MPADSTAAPSAGTGGIAGAVAPRSLADDLRARGDEELQELVRARPELVNPVPADIGQLAARATTQASVLRALDRLDRFLLQTVDVLAALPETTTREQVTAWLGTDADEPLAHLRRIALTWGDADAPRLVRTARQVLASATGLGPPVRDALGSYGPRRLAVLLADLDLPPQPDPVAAARSVAEHLSSPGVVDRLLGDAPAAARDLLDRLTWDSATGRVSHATRAISVAAATTPVEWSLARGLLVGLDDTTVAVPREVGVHLRGGRLHREVRRTPPDLDGAGRDIASVDRTAAGAAFDHLRHVEDLLEAWGVDGPPVLRAGGLGVRDLKRTATVLDLEEAQAAFVVETAYVAGLVGSNGEVDDQFWPTPAYDAWLSEPPGVRWAAVADAWLGTTRVAALVGQRDDRDKALAALGPELDRPTAVSVRAAVLDELAAADRGFAPTLESLQQRLAWRRPRRANRLQADLAAATLREAELLGVLGRGALSGPGRALVGGRSTEAASRLAGLLPTPLDHVLLQADLTAIAPGPLETDLAHELALVADIESKGGATVYRFTESTVRRALDAGRSAADLHELLATRSRTPVPQPLTYLVDDIARRHGRIRVGTARAYIRCDDESLLSQLVADRRAATLQLRRLAPTVVVAGLEVGAVLDRLREMGQAPMAESADGAVLIRRPDVHRTGQRQRPPRLRHEPPVPSASLLDAAVRAIRVGDRASTVRRSLDTGLPEGALPRSATVDTLAMLQDAAMDGRALWIGYVNNDGQASQRVIEPVRVDGGTVSAYDHLRGEVRSFAVHRITGVATLDGDA